MKRLALAALLVAVPAVVLGSTHYIVVTTHPFEDAVRRLPREDFDPVVGRVFARPFRAINGLPPNSLKAISSKSCTSSGAAPLRSSKLA